MVGFFWVVIGSVLGYWLAGNRKQGAAVRVACGLGYLIAQAVTIGGAFSGAVWAGGSEGPVSLAFGFFGSLLISAIGWIFKGSAAGWRAVSASGMNKRSAAAMVIGAWVVVWALGSFAEMMQEREEKKTAAAALVVPVASDCACASGAVCEGPQGGRYCTTEGGKKRYVKSQP